MKLPEIQQFAFQGSTQGQPFAPLNLPDPNPRLQANLATIAANYSTMAKSGVQQYERQIESSKQMQQLYEFVPKFLQGATELAVDVQDTLAKQNVVRELRHLKPTELKERVNDYYNTKQQLERTGDDALSPEARKLAEEKLAEWSGFMIGSRGLTAKYRDVEIAKMLGTVLPEWANDQRINNSGKIFVQGTEYTINDPNLPESISDLIIEQLIDDALGVDEISGKTALPMEIIGKHTIPLLNQNVAQIKQRFHKRIRSTRGESQRRDLIRKFDTLVSDPDVSLKDLGKDFENIFRFGSATTPRSGENYGIGFNVFGKDVIESLVTARKAGKEFDIDRLGEAVLPNGKLLKDHYSGFYNELSVKMKDAETSSFKTKLATAQAEVQQRILAFNSDLVNNPGRYSTDDVARFTAFMAPKVINAGMTMQSSGLLNLRSTVLRFGAGADERAPMIQSAIDAFTDNTLREDHPLYADELGRTHWTYEFAKKNSKEQNTPEHDAIKETVQGLVGEGMSSAKTLYGDILGTGKQMTEWYMRSIQPQLKYDLAALGPDATPEQKAGIITKYTKQAKDEIPAAFRAKSGHLFELNAEKRPFRWESRPEAQNTATDQLYSSLSHLTDVAKNGGNLYKELHNNPSSFAANDQILAVLPKLQSGQPLPAEYTLAAKHLNKAAGKEVFKNGMHIYGTLLRSVDPDLYKSSNFEQLARQYEQLPSPAQRYLDRHLSGEYVNWKSQLARSDVQGRGSFEGNLPAVPVTGSIPHPLNKQPGYTLPNITPLAGTSKAKLVNIPADAYRWLAYGASGEAGPGDDIYGVAASILNRYAEGRGSIQGIVTNPTQYEAVEKGTAKFRPDIEAKFKSPEGQAKLVEALIKLQGRTDFKGRTMYKNAGRTDVLFDSRGNFYHHPEEKSKNDVYSGPPKNAWRKFVSGL